MLYVLANLDLFGFQRLVRNYRGQHLLCTGWINAFNVLWDQLEGMNVRSATLIKLKKLRGDFLSKKKVKLVLVKHPLMGLAEYREMDLDEEEILKRLEISNLLYIFAKLETDLDLFRTIIKAQDEVGRFAKCFILRIFNFDCTPNTAQNSCLEDRRQICTNFANEERM